MNSVTVCSFLNLIPEPPEEKLVSFPGSLEEWRLGMSVLPVFVGVMLSSRVDYIVGDPQNK